MLLKAALVFSLNLLLAVDSKSCQDRFQNQNISPQYPLYVAHGSHSLTLNEIQTYFKKNANENNGIAIVNFNLTGDIMLPNAPFIVLNNK